MTTVRHYSFRGRRADGAEVSDIIAAADRVSAILQLEQEGVTALSLEERGGARERPATALRRETSADRLLVLQQISVLSRAGIPILEGVESIASTLSERSISGRLAEAGTALRRGEGIAAALKSALPGYPPHVYALIRVGETNGNLADVLEEAVRQLKYEQALRRDIANALSYPTFLVCAALAALTFLFMVVVPRFADMIGTERGTIDGLSRLVLDVGGLVHAHPLATLCSLGALVSVAVWSVTNPEARGRMLGALSRWPIVGERIVGAQRAEWARIMAFAVSTGVGILDAASIAFDAIPAGPFRERLNGSVRALRRGEPIADAFGASGALDAIDMSLLRTGQKAGKIGAMFTVIADRHEDDVRAGMKRMTTILEQVAIGLVALVIGTVVIGLVGAMTSIYETIG